MNCNHSTPKRTWARNRPLNPKDRFLSHVEQIPFHSCWEWIGSKNYKGYGHISGKTNAHRFSYELFIGEIPKGYYICHSCDNRACVNPAHLFAGTPQNNTDDMVKKGRQRPVRGEDHPRSRLNKELVVMIRQMRNDGMKLKEISNKIGFGIEAISSVIHMRTWKHVE